MSNALTSSLEDYLETIYLLQEGRDQEARVRDIAAARCVKASSVSPALKRLSDMGYLEYAQREMIRLTELGKVAARRVYARHVLLFQFFHDILGMEEAKARQEACGLEHALSDDGMDRFVQFFESRSVCATCDQCKAQARGDEMARLSHCADGACLKYSALLNPHTLDQVADFEAVKVVKILAKGHKRQAILDMGILPNVRLVRKATTVQGIVVEVEGLEMTLNADQTEAIVVTR